MENKMRWPIGSLTLMITGLSVLFALGEEPIAEWRSLPLIKDGEIDLAWMQIGYGEFVVDGETIRSECSEKGLGLLLYRPEKFGDCQIRVVYKQQDAKSNSGVYVRIDDGILKQIGNNHAPAKRDSAGKLTEESLALFQEASKKEQGPWYAVHHGYEVQICDSAAKRSRTGAVYSLAESSSLPDKKPSEWKTMLITLQGTKILVSVEGKQITSFDPASKDIPADRQWYEPRREPERPTTGYLGLQTHDPGDVVWFKEVSVRAIVRKE
jgi:hypothetical protein